MPDLKLQNQPFDLAFHPSDSILYTSLLTGEVKAFRYDEESGETSRGWTVRPTKKCARSLVVQEDGGKVWAVGKSGGIYGIDSSSGEVVDDRPEAHSAPVNRITNLFGSLFATGDDEGVIKLWDHRKPQQIREYRHHWEYISDFMFLEDKKQLIATSGDGTLSVMDVRASGSTPLSQSEDQDDELLSIVSIKGGTKSVVGSQLGVLSVWDRAKGWGDCVDRLPGHPASVETLVSLTPDIIATGSEDGLIRVMQLYPTKFLGVIASHDDFPIERIKLDRNGKWLGSVSHDDTLKLTDVSDLFEASDGEDEDEEMEGDTEEGVDVNEDGDVAAAGASDVEEAEDGEGDEDEEMDSDDEEERKEEERAKKEAKKDQKGLRAKLAASGEEQASAKGNNFFDDL